MRRLFTLTFALFICLASCQKAPEITITTPATIEMSSDGSNGTITFTANRDWTARTSEGWVHISQTSGEASKEQVSITVRCDANTTYDDRTATVTITIDGMSQTVKITQPANLGIVLPTKSYDLQAGARTIEVVVQANVDYTMDISDEWIKRTGTKGLTSTTHIFSIEENTTYDNREGQITIKPKQPGVAEQVISVKQAQKDALNVEKNSYEMPYGGGEFEIKVETNVEYNVTPDSDWLHHVSTKALNNSTVLISVDENDTYNAREGKVEIAQQNGSVKHIITVTQAGRIAVTSIELDKTSLTLKPEGTVTLVAIVKPDDATNKAISWSTSEASIATVDNGKVTAISPGMAVITVSSVDNPSIQAICSITVSNVPQSAVDLGLSVLWAPVNLGAEKPEDYGDYFAWGETIPKRDYSWETYKWCMGTSITFTKYCQCPEYGYNGFTDEKTILDLEDDAAHVILGDDWRMPRYEEITELVNNCTWEWTSISGVYGYIITGPSGNSIFLPAASSASLQGFVGSYGFYWSSSLVTVNPNLACLFTFIHEDMYEEVSHGGSQRFVGGSIRPVYGPSTFKNVPVENVILKENQLNLFVGGKATMIAEVFPFNATNISVSWTSSDISIASVSSSGVVTGVAPGSAIITVTTNDGGKKASCSVSVTAPSPNMDASLEAIDLGLPSGLKWASFNLGATSPEDFGDFFAWGETEPYYSSYDPLMWKEGKEAGYDWPSYRWCMGSEYTMTKYCQRPDHGYNGFTDDKTVLDLEDDAAHVILGDDWRMPTDAEFAELQAYCSWEWTSINGIYGRKVTGPNGNSIFLPAAGTSYGGNINTTGCYWSSSLDTECPWFALYMYINSNQGGTMTRSYYSRFFGFSIRPVTK